MKKRYIIFLQALLLIIGLGTFLFMLWEPHLEGRNVNASWFDIYFKDPFLAYVYSASIFFFMTLSNFFILLTHSRLGTMFSLSSVSLLYKAKIYIGILVLFIIGAEAYFIFFQKTNEDIAGGVVLGVGMLIVCLITAFFTNSLEKRIRRKLIMDHLQK